MLRLRGVVRVDDGAKLHSDSGVADTLRLRVGPVLAKLQGLLGNVLALCKTLGMRCLKISSCSVVHEQLKKKYTPG